MGSGGLKETVLKILLVIFVIFLVGAFVYFLLLAPRTKREPHAIKVYFLKEEKLVPLVRQVEGGDPPERSAMDELLKGPTKEEKSRGIFTEIPEGTKTLRVFVEGDTAFVDFNERVGEYGGGSARVQGLISQIIYTMTEVPGIKKVGILVEGKSDVVLGGEGYVLERPLGRDDVRF